MKLLLFIVALFVSIPVETVGREAPEFSSVDFNTGKEISLKDYKGKVVFIDFWASWCPPCIKALPAYNKMRHHIGTDKFEVIAINVDAKKGNGENFIRRNPVSFPVIMDTTGSIGKRYQVRAMPTSFIVDQQGLIVSVIRGYEPGDEINIQKEIQALIH